MFEFFQKLFGTDFMPHAYCLRQPGLIWLHVASDGLIALSYFLIPITLVRIIRLRRDLVFSWMFVLFGIFILSCGLTHLLAIWTLWHPVYRFEGLIKAITALASLPTAILLIRLAPQIVSLPRPEELRTQIRERERAETEVRRLNQNLESEIGDRTKDLEKASRQLAESELRTRAILDSSQAVIYMKDLDGHYQFVNRQFEHTFGFNRQQVYGKTDSELWRSEMATNYRANDQTVLAHGPQQIEELAMQRDGMHTYLSVKVPLLDLEGQLLGICGISTDITERKQMEAALRRSNAELREFAYAAAHDLQEPLRNISTSLGLLRRKHRQQLSGEAYSWVEESERSAQHMHRMVKDLLELTEVARSPAPAAVTTDVNRVLQQVLDNLCSAISDANAQITYGPLPSVRVEEAHLEQLLQNLIGNALKYRHLQRRAAISISAIQRGTDWLFSIADNGIGFEPAYAEKIFGVFRRLHARHEYEGNGIGLAICARIVSHYSGTIWAEGQPGIGATFRFTLPAAESAS